jgi:hypothetical protein
MAAASANMCEMKGDTCAICRTNPATRVGEHIWPKWFMKLMDRKGQSPVAWAVNGKPISNLAGKPIQLPQRTRVFLPVCTDCNGALAARFEDPAKPVVETLAVNKWHGTHSAAEWSAVGMWWAKVLLLLGHDRARVNHRDLNAVAVRFDGPPPDYAWMVDGSGPPTDLSLFVFDASMEKAQPEFDLVIPAGVRRADHTTVPCHVMNLATPNIGICVVSHPGLSITHPLVEQEVAWELLHSAPDNANLSDLDQRSYTAVSWMRGGIVPEGHQVNSSEVSQHAAMFGYESDAEGLSTNQKEPRR